MLKLVCAESIGDELSVTFMVNVLVPEVPRLGMPVIAPVVGCRLRPEGKVPLIMLQVYGGVPPFALTVAA